MLNVDEKKTIETMLVEMLIAIRDRYVKDRDGRVKPDYLEQIQNRSRSSAEMAPTINRWVNELQVDLQMGSIDTWDSSASLTLLDLVQFCDEHNCHREAKTLILKDGAFLFARVRRQIALRKEESQREKQERLLEKLTADGMMAAAEDNGLVTEEI
jgi:hypothetical protein